MSDTTVFVAACLAVVAYSRSEEKSNPNVTKII